MRTIATLFLLMSCLTSCSKPATVAHLPPALPPPVAAPTTVPVVSTQTAHLIIRAVDLRNKNGQLIMTLYNSPQGFPGSCDKAIHWQIKPADSDGIFVLDLPPGQYAASILHDENSNSKMDTNFLGIPVEGYGVTNNPKPHRRAATFQEAIFVLPARGADLSISMQYSFF